MAYTGQTSRFGVKTTYRGRAQLRCPVLQYLCRGNPGSRGNSKAGARIPIHPKMTDCVRPRPFTSLDPSFLGIGVQKCATTWIYQMLAAHPDVFVSHRKEIGFFNRQDNYRRGLAWYREHFAGRSSESQVSEYTPTYMWTAPGKAENLWYGRNRDIPQLVHAYRPSMKLIVSLRDPVERAVSAYYHHLGRRRYSPAKSITEVGARYGIVSMGFYYSQLVEWLQWFDFSQMLVLIYEQDIAGDPMRAIRSLYRFLHVDEDFRPAVTERRYRPRRGGFYLGLHYYFPRLSWAISRLPILGDVLKRIGLSGIRPTPQEITQLASVYAEENRKLAELLGRDVPEWYH